MRVTTAGQTQAIIARLQASAQRSSAPTPRHDRQVASNDERTTPTAGAMVMQASSGLRGVAQ
jgi:hypothetical protein